MPEDSLSKMLTTTLTTPSTLTEPAPIPTTTSDLEPFDIGTYFNAKHTEHLTEFFPTEQMQLAGIPFEVKLSGLNMVRTGVQEKQSITIRVGRDNVSTIYVIGYGTYLAQVFGHQNLYCDELNHFSFTVMYSDGTVEETFPTDVILGKRQWSDILRSDGAVANFPARPVAYIHLYAISTDSAKRLESITMNDKHEQAQYVIFALTLES